MGLGERADSTMLWFAGSENDVMRTQPLGKYFYIIREEGSAPVFVSSMGNCKIPFCYHTPKGKLRHSGEQQAALW